jgi:hypothetical protein
MKTINLLTLTVVTGSLLAFTGKAGIVGTGHDFSQATFNQTVNQGDQYNVCGVCHTPHHASATLGPLWNHDAAVQSWTMYGSGSPGANVRYSAVTQPRAGSIAPNAYGRNDVPGGAPNRTAGSSAPFGAGSVLSISEASGNLSHSHPISFQYSTVATPSIDNNLHLPSDQVLIPDTGSPNFNMGSDMSITKFLLDKDGYVECSSCHDVHAQDGSAADSSTQGSQNLNPNLLRINGAKIDSNTGHEVGSLLCRSCHKK